jgi:hypothetical protein
MHTPNNIGVNTLACLVQRSVPAACPTAIGRYSLHQQSQQRCLTLPVHSRLGWHQLIIHSRLTASHALLKSTNSAQSAVHALPCAPVPADAGLQGTHGIRRVPCPLPKGHTGCAFRAPLSQHVDSLLWYSAPVDPTPQHTNGCLADCCPYTCFVQLRLCVRPSCCTGVICCTWARSCNGRVN